METEVSCLEESISEKIFVNHGKRKHAEIQGREELDGHPKRVKTVPINGHLPVYLGRFTCPSYPRVSSFVPQAYAIATNFTPQNI